ncbi:DNA-binding transcriptional regulator, AcrR family [Actinokineospora alba]|uniref:DNA-binding transcriptional regulator, AcrR family n=1 Tax=Actinokineospora alba TaxID=504798 RepID=A0A1H0TWS1_9PSEU|nr:TetR/AcrR family transcriptional regulator [Actinokineospora alba]TDP70771.1 TetR family transcriptional regulator [Actinokineospora alba]SDJ15999.1 DNA-binding transcriptional regulator, AcrR family [Actinokineospora alba]SDP58562.1 DNA-binding transcriptional regulator, AcrR family [Actinokineospora alba]
MTAEVGRVPVRRPRNRKAQLAEAAADLFGKRGYHAVGVNDIAAAAGITGPAVYRHFPNKQAVLGHVLLTGVDVLTERLTEVTAAAEGDPHRCVGPLLHTAAAVSIEQRELTALWRWQGRHLHDGDQKEIQRRVGTLLAQAIAGLRGLRPELSAADAHLLSFAAMSVYGSVGDHHVNYAREPFELLLARLAEAVVLSDVVPATQDAPQAAWRARTQMPVSRREELLTAATRLFRDHGYHAVSMEDIGAVTGIAGPSIYRHFAAKSDILLAASRRMADRLQLGLDTALAEAADPADALHRLTRSYADTVQRSDDLIAVYTSELVNLPERDAKELRRLQRGYVAEWVRLLREMGPALTEPEARVAVHAALTVVNDLPRTGRVKSRPALTAEIAGLAMAVLREAAHGS